MMAIHNEVTLGDWKEFLELLLALAYSSRNFNLTPCSFQSQ